MNTAHEELVESNGAKVVNALAILMNYSVMACNTCVHTSGDVAEKITSYKSVAALWFPALCGAFALLGVALISPRDLESSARQLLVSWCFNAVYTEFCLLFLLNLMFLL